MAKVRYKLINEAEGALNLEIQPSKKKSRSSVVFTKNQYGLIIRPRTRTGRKKSNTQIAFENRFKQLECMYKAMTPKQKHIYHARTIKHNLETGERLRATDLFKREGLKYRLYEFLRDNLNAEYRLVVLRETEDKVVIALDLENTKVHLMETAAGRILKGGG